MKRTKKMFNSPIVLFKKITKLVSAWVWVYQNLFVRFFRFKYYRPNDCLCNCSCFYWNGRMVWMWSMKRTNIISEESRYGFIYNHNKLYKLSSNHCCWWQYRNKILLLRKKQSNFSIGHCDKSFLPMFAYWYWMKLRRKVVLISLMIWE